MHLILGNSALLREAGALQAVWDAVKATGLRWESVSMIPDPDSHSPHDSQTAYERQEALDEINGELALYLAVLYIMVEVFRGEEEWAEDLSACRRCLTSTRSSLTRKYDRSEARTTDADPSAQPGRRTARAERQRLPREKGAFLCAHQSRPK